MVEEGRQAGSIPHCQDRRDDVRPARRLRRAEDRRECFEAEAIEASEVSWAARGVIVGRDFRFGEDGDGKKNPHGADFTSWSRNSIASALCPVFSSRAAAGSRFSNGLPTATTRRRSISSAPAVSPDASRFRRDRGSWRPRVGALLSRAQRPVRGSCAPIALSPASNSRRAAARRISGAGARLRVGAIGGEFGIQSPELSCRLQVKGQSGSLRYAEFLLGNAAIAEAAYSVLFGAGEILDPTNLPG